MFFFLAKPCPFFASQDQSWGPWLGQVGVPVFFQGPFFASSARSRRAPAERTFGSLSGGRGFFFLLSGVECLRVERAGGWSSARTRVVRFFSCCQEGAWPGGWQDGRGFFLGGVPSFFRARQEAAWGASRRRVLRRSPFFLGFCVARGGPPPPSAGGRRRRRVLRRSDAGLFFFPVRTRSSTPRRPVPPWRRHGCWSSNGRRRDPFFFFSGLGGTRKPVLQVDLMKEIASQARFSSFFSPLFGGVFSGQATRVAVLEEALRGEKAWTQGFQARCRSSFPPPLPSRCAPPGGRPRAPSASRLIRRSLKSIGFRARAPRRRLRSVAVAEDPLAVVFPLFFPIDPSQECEPRPTFTFDLGLDLEKALEPAAFFLGVFPVLSGHLGVPSGHLGVPSGHSAERALR